MEIAIIKFLIIFMVLVVSGNDDNIGLWTTSRWECFEEEQNTQKKNKSIKKAPAETKTFLITTKWFFYMTKIYMSGGGVKEVRGNKEYFNIKSEPNTQFDMEKEKVCCRGPFFLNIF